MPLFVCLPANTADPIQYRNFVQTPHIFLDLSAIKHKNQNVFVYELSYSFYHKISSCVSYHMEKK